MRDATVDGAKVKERLQLYLDRAERERIGRVGDFRGTTEAATVRWLLRKSLDWWEGLSREQKDIQ